MHGTWDRYVFPGGGRHLGHTPWVTQPETDAAEQPPGRGCPSCSASLAELIVEDVHSDVCPDCGGLWFLLPELTRCLGELFDADALFRTATTGSTRRRCPGCGETMTAHLHPGMGRMIELDHCEACEGLWLDQSELQAISARESPTPLRPRPAARDPLPGLEHYHGFDMSAEVDRQSIAWSTYFFCLFTQMPVEVHAPRRAYPTFLLILVVVNFVCFALTFSQPLGDAIATLTTWGLVPQEALRPQGWYQLVSYAFLHSSFGHISGNLYFLWIFGDNVLDVFRDHGRIKGPLYFLAFYLTAAVLGGLLHAAVALTNPGTAAMPLVGASGAVSAVMAAYWRLFPRSRLYQLFFLKSFKVPLWLYFGLWLLFNLALAAALGPHSRVSWEAHLGGFFTGYLLLEVFLPYRLTRWRRAPPASSAE